MPCLDPVIMIDLELSLGEELLDWRRGRKVEMPFRVPRRLVAKVWKWYAG